MKQFTSRMAVTAALASSALAVATVHARAQEGPPMMLSVDNARTVPVVVFVELGAYDTRIGTVPAHSQKDLRLPIQFRDGARVMFTVHPEGGLDLTTPDGLVMHRGEPVSLYVPTGNEGFVSKPPLEVIPNPGLEGSTLTVENSSDRAVVAFIERGAFDTRLGMVSAGDSKTFSLPPYLTNERRSIDVFLHEEGGEDLASTTFDLTPDAHLVVKVPG